MSVVNQMLLELDRRRASAGERAGLPGMVRPLPPASPSLARPALAGLALLTVCGVAAAAWLALGRISPASTQAATASAPVEPAPQRAAPAEAEPQLKGTAQLAAAPTSEPGFRNPRTSPHPNPLPRAGEGKGGGETASAPRTATPARIEEAQPPVPATAGHGIRTGEPVVEKTSAESVAPSRAPAGQADALAAAMREARALAQRGEASAAMELLKQYSAAGGGNAEYHGLHAAVLQRLTLHAEAVDEYRAALRLAPSASVWWLGLGISLEALGRAREAREAFERARGGGLSAELAAFAEQRIGALR